MVLGQAVSLRILFGRGSGPTMRAIVHDRYGSPDDLHVRDIGKPVVTDEGVLVRVHAAGLHVGDCFGVRGVPLLMRVVTGPLKPKYGVPGFDVAGWVEAVGTKVTRFDRVMRCSGCATAPARSMRAPEKISSR